MQQLLFRIDAVSTFIGKAAAWLCVPLTLLICWEVFSRYAFNKPHAWVLDAQIMLYGTMFMLAGAYTLAKNGHVRGDVLYGFFSPRVQAGLDLALYILFFLPGVLAMLGRLDLCPGVAGDSRADLLRRAPAAVPIQVCDSAGGRCTAAAGSGRDCTLRDLSAPRRVAQAC